ncbi:MAG: DUF721 domain-containing protein [Candidatus Binatia bacterium]
MATRAKTSSWNSAAAVLGALLPHLPGTGRLREYRVWEVWEEAVGGAVARKAQPSGMQNGRLFVTVSNAVWMQEMQFSKALIKDKINQRLGSPVIRDIFFVLGRARNLMLQPATPPSRPLPPFRELRVPPLSDPQLEAAFAALLAARRRRLAAEESHD